MVGESLPLSFPHGTFNFLAKHTLQLNTQPSPQFENKRAYIHQGYLSTHSNLSKPSKQHYGIHCGKGKLSKLCSELRHVQLLTYGFQQTITCKVSYNSKNIQSGY